MLQARKVVVAVCTFVAAAALVIAAGASPEDARKWWTNELAARANDRGVDLVDVGVTPAQVARVSALVADGTLTARLARDVLAAVADGEGEPDAIRHLGNGHVWLLQ